MKQTPKDIRIPVTIGGVTFKNPFFVASGPTTKSVRQLIEIERTGWAAASIKLSIDPAPYINRKPRYSLFKYSYVFSPLLSDYMGILHFVF